MAIEQNICGHEIGDNSEFIYGSSGTGGVPGGGVHSLAAAGRTGTYCYRTTGGVLSGNPYFSFFPAGSVIGTSGTVTSGNKKRARVRVYVRIDGQSFSFPTSQGHIFGFGNETGTAGVWFDGNRRFGIRVTSGAVVMSSAQLALSTWYQVTLDVLLDVSANTLVTATLTVRADDDDETLIETVSTTGTIGASDALDLLGVGELRQSIFGITGTYDFDDWVYQGTSMADAVSAITLPTGNEVHGMIAPDGFASNQFETGTYTDVDEFPVSTDSMSSILGTGTEVEFTHASAIALEYGSVHAMKLYANVKVSGAGTGAVDLILNGVATSVVCTTNYPASAVAYNPKAGILVQTLTGPQFSATTFGVKKQNGTQQTLIGNIGIEVLASAFDVGSGTQIRGNTQIKEGTIYDAQIADAANISRSKIHGLGDSPSPIFFPEDHHADDWLVPGPPGASGALVRIPTVPIFFPEDSEEAMLMAASSSSSSGGGGSTTNNYSTYLGSQVLLAELTASASSSLDFATRNAAGQSGAMFQSDYDEYIVEFINVLPGTNSVGFWIRMSTDGGASYDSGNNYRFANYLVNDSGSFSTNSVAASSTSRVTVASETVSSTAANGGICGNVKLTNPLSATQHKTVNGQTAALYADGNWYNALTAGAYKSTTAVNAIQFLMSSGTIASGTIRIYGLTKTAQSIQNAAAHGHVLLHTQTVAGASTLDVVSRNVGSLSGAIFQSDYDEYVFELVNLAVGTNDAGILGRVSTDGGATYSATTYARTFQYGASNNTTSGGGATGQTFWDISGNQSNASTSALVGFLKLYDPLSATRYKQMVGCVAWGHTGVDWISTEYSLIWKTITAINAFRLLTSSGTITGTLRVYGVVKDATYPVSTIQTGTHASRPTFGNPGRIYLPSDGYSLGRDSGTAWETWGPFSPFTPPSDTGFAWVNQGTSSIATTKDALALVGAATGSGANIVARVKTAPATPYVITAALQGAMIEKQWQSYGLVFRESSSGKIHTFDFLANGTLTALRSAKFTSATVFSAQYIDAAVATGGGLLWLRISDDGTNRKCSFSRDGVNFIEIHSVGRTDFLTADQVGFMVGTENAATPNYAPVVTVLSWKQS